MLCLCRSRKSVLPRLGGTSLDPLHDFAKTRNSAIRSWSSTSTLHSVVHGLRSALPRKHHGLKSTHIQTLKRYISDDTTPAPNDTVLEPLDHEFLDAECLAALRGERLPDDTTINNYFDFYKRKAGGASSIDGNTLTEEERAHLEDAFLQFGRLHAASIYGIRHHEKLAFSKEVELSASTTISHARARNARCIMSNIIPVMDTDAAKPYCIWHPDIASEDTYRELVRRYPDMRYNVGRACAAAGYNKLYHELNLLPDVSIAEEAKDNTKSGASIFHAITSQNVRYKVMDDYTCTVRLNDPPADAFLNGDTAVRSSLSHRDSYKTWPYARDTPHYFDITEESSIAEETCHGRVFGPMPSEHVDLLYSPLPRDLPTTYKDVLINMAAYEGNIDRFSRLRRPNPVTNELMCVARGIYHHVPFARWLEPRLDEMYPQQRISQFGLRQALHARFIMSNDLSRIDASIGPSDIPMVIWYPHMPRKNTLRELYWRHHDMSVQIGIACIIADYQDVYDEVKPLLHRLLWLQAKQSTNPYYLQDIERRAAEAELHLSKGTVWDLDFPNPWPDEVYEGVTKADKEPTNDVLTETIANDPRSVTGGLTIPQINTLGSRDGIYGGGFQANAGLWETFISATDEARKSPGQLYSSEADFTRRATKKSQFRRFTEFMMKEMYPDLWAQRNK
ncbi:uncharacterized protein CTRU02_208742 [Colletotrichum truncatum]|uniref:Uncharacterized protein n=1 Tax=Colletotrichum truncatum TaxID=5467 RepID=A0ACC3YZM2_COLTU|nr:uncharacterized protein CTRU02_06599 [Colletotrichum truncatum]KAF6792516.1 hypothetical protein CTRU02_06599 [Colletotrichum truncatum]